MTQKLYRGRSERKTYVLSGVSQEDADATVLLLERAVYGNTQAAQNEREGRDHEPKRSGA